LIKYKGVYTATDKSRISVKKFKERRVQRDWECDCRVSGRRCGRLKTTCDWLKIQCDWIVIGNVTGDVTGDVTGM